MSLSANSSAKSPQASLIQQAIADFSAIRENIIAMLEALETTADIPLYPGPAGRFVRSKWQRGDGSQDLGGGEAAMLRGRLFEKAGVHFSHVHGPIPKALKEQMRGANNSKNFTAAGVSVIIHPINPKIPAAHMNMRIISTDRSWFGGGADLTPLLDSQRRPDCLDSKEFHATMQETCNRFPGADYSAFRQYCDKYFYLPHRSEPRGTGGTFFDHLDSGDQKADLAFTSAVGQGFLSIYQRIASRRLRQAWSSSERQQQLIRRGQYVEFNLLYDRGTSFGLKSGGNVEAILSSLPPVVKWP